MDIPKGTKVTKLPARAARGLKRSVPKARPAAGEMVVDRPVVRRPDRPWEALGSVDIETLVVWAFRDQQADRMAHVGLHRIEADFLGMEPSGRSTDGCAALADIENLGCRIDRASGMMRDHVHPAAEAVVTLAASLKHGNLLRHFGTLGGRPDGWREPARWFRPVVWIEVGKQGQWEQEGRGKAAVRFTRVIPTVTREELVRRRSTYSEWLEALGQLRWLLSTRALGFTVLPPAAPLAPWAEPVRG